VTGHTIFFSHATQTAAMSRCGLLNSGNTCFLNTAIQILARTKLLIDFLDKGISHANMQISDTVLLHEFNALRQSMALGPIVDPQRFIKAVKLVANYKHIDMNPTEQNDVAEFMLFLLDCFHNALRRGVTIKPHQTTDPLATACRAALEHKYTTDYSELVEMFNGILVTSVASKLNSAVSHRAEPYLMLDLPLDQTTLHDCIDAFLSTEHIDGWHNDTTGANEPAEKRSSLWTLPPVIIFVLKRFCPMTRRKNDKLIVFPLEHLDMRRYVPKSPAYRCYAVANHMGSANMGHYSAFVRDPAINGWVSYDDAAVRPLAGPANVITQFAYCLFYEAVSSSIDAGAPISAP